LPNRYGLAIRAANAGDAEGIGVLLRAAGLAMDHRGLPLRLEEIPLQAGLVLLAEDWGPPGGVLALRWSWTLFEAQKVAEVTALAVDPEQRRKGIARLLLKAAARAARSAGCGELRLLAPEGAEGLAEFCAATGFDRLGETFTRPLRKRGAADDQD